MRHWVRMLAAVSGGVVLVGLAAPVTSAAPSTSSPTPIPRGSRTQLHHGTSAAAARAARPVTRLIVRTSSGRPLSGAGLAAAGRLAGSPTTPASRALSRGQSLVYLGTPLTAAEAWSAAEKLAARADVVWAEPDLPVYASDASPVTPNDPLFPSQWDAWDTSVAVGGSSTRIPATWNRTKGDKSVVVAVLDTGLTVHPDITGSVAAPTASDQIVKGYDFVAGDPDNGGRTYYVANDGNGRDADPSDPGDWITASDAAGNTAGGIFLNCFADSSSWHGTHVTGTIVAKQGNGLGITGIAPGVKVQPVRVLGRCGGYSSDINDAIEWASGGHIVGVPDNPTPASVINMSLGGPGSCLVSTQQAITDARGRGTTVVVAAGNEGINLDSDVTQGSQPADCAGVVRVTATTRAGAIATYSNTGDAGRPATLAAPGGSGAGGSANDILSTLNAGTTTPAGATYAAYAGTSMATPHVAAAAALLQSTRVGRTAYTPDEVQSQLVASTRPFAAGAGPNGSTCTSAVCGAGILDLSSLPTEAPLAPTVTVTPGDGHVYPSWVPGDGGGLPVTYDVEWATSPTGPWTLEVNNTPLTATPLAAANGTDYWVRVTASNTEGSAAPVVVGPARASTYAQSSIAVTGGVERITAQWQAPVAPATPVTSFAFRYRIVGAPDWLTATAAAGTASTTLTTWPTASLPAGDYEVQLAALHDALTPTSPDSEVDWTPSLRAKVVSLINGTTVSATTLRPFRDAYQDSVVARVSTNRPGGASGQLRILNAAKVPVKIVALGAGSSWSVVWTGLSSRNLRVPNGRYYFQAYLPGVSGALVAVPNPPSVVVASSQAAKPTLTLSSKVVFPYRDGYQDAITVSSSALVPSTMTWKVIRSGKVYWQTTFTRRGTARALYAGAKIGGGTLPAGTYGLYVYAKGGEGTTTVAATTLTVYAKRALKTPFRVVYQAGAIDKAYFWDGPYPPVATSQTVALNSLNAVTFQAPLPTTVLPYAGIHVQVDTVDVSGPIVPAFGYYGGNPLTPNAIRPVAVTTDPWTSPTAPTVAALGGSLRFYLENDDDSSSSWTVQTFVVTGFRYVLAG